MSRTLVLFALCCLAASCQRAPAVQTVEVLVAVEDIPMGTVFADSDKRLRWVKYLKEHKPAESIGDVASLQGQLAARPIWKDQPLTTADVAGKRFQLTPGYVVLRVGINPDGTRYGVDSRPEHIRQVADAMLDQGVV